MEVYNREFFSSFAEVDRVVEETLKALKKIDIEGFEKVEFRVNFMLREILNNAVEHGNLFDRTKKVSLIVFYENSVLIFKVQDEGTGIDVKRHGLNDFVLRERNRGYEVIKNFCFDVILDGNQVEISLNVKKIK